MRQFVKVLILAKKSGGKALAWKMKEVGKGLVCCSRARARWEIGVRSAPGPKEGVGGIFWGLLAA